MDDAPHGRRLKSMADEAELDEETELDEEAMSIQAELEAREAEIAAAEAADANSGKSMEEELAEQHGKSVEGSGVAINMFRRAKDQVDDRDVPFLLEVPHTSSETVYNVMTECYGLRGKRYLKLKELQYAAGENVVDRHYVSAHNDGYHPDHYRHMGRRFHFLSTPFYQEGARLLTLGHKGRMVMLLRHPNFVAEAMYNSRPGSVAGDVDGLLAHVNSTGYYDNWMTRMLANVHPSRDVTDDDFRTARMILENKFLLGASDHMPETVRRMSIYFGWQERTRGCEHEGVQRNKVRLPPTALSPDTDAWRAVQRANRYDMKLYARGLSVFGNQKMRMPVHPDRRKIEADAVTTAFRNLRKVADPHDESDVPFFWHIPKASGTTVKEIISGCYRKVRTEMIKPPSSLELFDDKKVLNLDLSTPGACRAARDMNAADQGVADVFISQLGRQGAAVFSEYHMGRAFTVMRHPVKLAASLFYYRRIATWEPTYRPDFNDITLEQYVEEDAYYDNWMVRMITNAKMGGLNDGHLDLAMSIIREKFVVGISDHMDQTFRHLELYFGWRESTEGCVDFHLHKAPSNKNKYDMPVEGGVVWSLIAEKNKYDMALYNFALDTFSDQAERMFKAVE